MMFQGVVTERDWPSEGMNGQRWLNIPATLVTIADLTMTQDGVYFHALIDPPTPRGGDLLPHVIDWQGRLFLEDGHHRVTRALILGQDTILARIYRPEEQ